MVPNQGYVIVSRTELLEREQPLKGDRAVNIHDLSVIHRFITFLLFQSKKLTGNWISGAPEVKRGKGWEPLLCSETGVVQSVLKEVDLPLI